MAAQRASFASDNYAPSQHPHANNINVFDDEFEEDYADSIHTTISRQEDPFRDPVGTTGPSHIYSNDLLLSRPSEVTSIQARNSIGKSSQDIPSMRSAPVQNILSRTQDEELSTRQLSLVSSASLATPQSPTTTDQTGPSHPYAMYPQNFPPSRTASNATARSVEAAATLSNRQGPMHPYNLYPQTIPSDSSRTGSQSTSVPIGFPGHAQHFHRRLGPEGEEQDIVGPHGHTEQLPPYSRYPDTYDNKAAAVGLLSATGDPADGERAPHTPVEMQERQPMVGDAHFADAPDPRRDTNSNNPPAATVPVSEKTWREKTWKEKRKTKLWGPLSVGAVLLTVFVIVIIAVICGGVIGGVLRKKQFAKDRGPWYVAHPTPASKITITTTEYIDATPTDTPLSGSPLPTGTYQVVFADANVSIANCLEDSNQRAAWSCDIPDSQKTMSVEVYFQYGQAYMSLLNLTSVIDYGAQAPVLLNEPLKTVTDLNNPSFGVAYQFQGLYNKLVVIPEPKLPSKSNAKRYAQTTASWSSPYSSRPWLGTRKHVSISVGDSPWFCWWNNTIIEGFLFLDEDLYYPISSTYVPQSYAPTSPSMPNPSMSSAVTANQQTVSCLTCGPASTTSAALQTFTTSSCSETKPWYQQRRPVLTQFGPPYNVRRTSIATSATVMAASAPSSTTPCVYPRLMNFEERRWSLHATTSAAICTKMSKGQDGIFTTVSAAGGMPVTVSLDEQDVDDYGKKRAAALQERAGGQCSCKWSNFPDS